MNAIVSKDQVNEIRALISRRADQFKMILPSHISPDKFQQVVATAAIGNPQLLQCDKQSFVMAALKLAQDGLLPDGREAALVPFKTSVKNGNGWTDSWQVTPMPMAYGLRKKVLQSGEVISLETGVVYRCEVEDGNFIYEIGITPPIRHRPKLDMTAEQYADSEIVAAYSIAKLKNEQGGEPYWSVEIMRRFQIDKARQSSQTGAVGRVYKFGQNKGKVIEPKGPWVDHFPEMARKTVLRAHTKVLPMSGDVLETFQRDRDEELRAEGAAAVLDQMQDTAPQKSLPSGEQLDEDQGDDDQGFDPATGEVTGEGTGEDTGGDADDASGNEAGNSDAERETAEKLDAEAGNGREAGDPGPQPDGRSAQSEKPDWQTICEGIIQSAAKAATIIDVKNIEREWAEKSTNRGSWPDAGLDLADSVDREIASARKRLGK